MWLLWYALRIGLGYEEALRQTTGRLRLLMAITQVKTEGAEFVDNREFDPETMELEEFIPGLF